MFLYFTFSIELGYLDSTPDSSTTFSGLDLVSDSGAFLLGLDLDSSLQAGAP